MQGRQQLVLLSVLVSALLIQGCAADHLTIGALSGLSAIGDRLELNGTTDAKGTIAVFLLLSGPGLDKRGVCLENLNLPAGYGYFTSAYVNPDGTWRYIWDTRYLAGRLLPGTYTVYVVNLPLGLPHSEAVSSAKTNITFTRMADPGLGADVILLCLAGISGAGLILVCRNKR